MPRTITALGGQESQAHQIPVSLVRLEIPGTIDGLPAEKCMHDLADSVALYLNPTTNAVAMAAGAGLVKFVPYAGMEVPQIEITDEAPLSEVAIALSNVDGIWYDIMAANQYREMPATIWQGNLSLPAGTSPFLVTFVGAVTMWAGKIVHIVANPVTATIRMEPPDPFTQVIPHRFYSAPGFVHMAAPGSKFLWGGGTVEG